MAKPPLFIYTIAIAIQKNFTKAKLPQMQYKGKGIDKKIIRER